MENPHKDDIAERETTDSSSSLIPMDFIFEIIQDARKFLDMYPAPDRIVSFRDAKSLPFVFKKKYFDVERYIRLYSDAADYADQTIYFLPMQYAAISRATQVPPEFDRDTRDWLLRIALHYMNIVNFAWKACVMESLTFEAKHQLRAIDSALSLGGFRLIVNDSAEMSVTIKKVYFITWFYQKITRDSSAKKSKVLKLLGTSRAKLAKLFPQTFEMSAARNHFLSSFRQIEEEFNALNQDDWSNWVKVIKPWLESFIGEYLDKDVLFPKLCSFVQTQKALLDIEWYQLMQSNGGTIRFADMDNFSDSVDEDYLEFRKGHVRESRLEQVHDNGASIGDSDTEDESVDNDNVLDGDNGEVDGDDGMDHHSVAPTSSSEVLDEGLSISNSSRVSISPLADELSDISVELSGPTTRAVYLDKLDKEDAINHLRALFGHLYGT